VKPTERPHELPPTGLGSTRSDDDGAMTLLIGLVALSAGLVGLGYWRLRMNRRNV
jgi:hypothetical protein